MPLIDATETKKPFQKKKQRQWDLMGEAAPAAGESEAAAELSPAPASADGVKPLAHAALIELSHIRPDVDQVRRSIDLDSAAMTELVASIRSHGVQQPITVWRDGDGEYEIVFGERRFHAAKRAGLAALPCLVLASRPAPEDKTALQLIENLHRADMSPFDEAAAYQALVDEHGLTHEQIATKIGRSRVHITKTLQLSRLSPAVRSQCSTSNIGGKALSFEHLFEIARQETPERQAALLHKIKSEGLNVRALRATVKARGGNKKPVRTQFKSHKFVDPEDRFWMMIHFKQPKVSPKEVISALEKAIADVKRSLARAQGARTK